VDQHHWVAVAALADEAAYLPGLEVAPRALVALNDLLARHGAILILL
jgi:hypothetical protein